MHAQNSEPLLKLRKISKEFVQVKALDNIDFELSKGEICSVLGENGAGKSTLMKIIAGVYQPDSGTIYINGKEMDFHSPRDSVNHGIGMVYQHFNLVEEHQVWENIVLGTAVGVYNKSAVCSRIRAIGSDFGLSINPESFVWELSVGQKQSVEILKSLYRNADILVLDEPTAVLTPQETERLFSILKSMVAKGLSIIFISHKLNEIMENTDRIVVLSSGKVVGEVMTKDTTSAELAQMMVGEKTISYTVNKEHDLVTEKEVVVVDNVTIKNDYGRPVVANVSFSIHEGEILGVAGVSGNGQRELAGALSGTQDISFGRITAFGEDISNLQPWQLIKKGFARIPEDRMVEGLNLSASVSENLVLEIFDNVEFGKKGVMDWKKVRKHAEKLIGKFDIRPPLPMQTVKTFSGGNIQKVILARELHNNPRVVIAAQPTRGLDVKATNDVQGFIMEQKRKAAAILFISEDLGEVMDLSDRIMVMHNGEIMAILNWNEADINRIGLLMTGVREVPI